MKKLVVISLTLLVLAGAGSCGWLFLANRDAVAAELRQTADGAGLEQAGLVFVDIAPIQLPLMGKDRIEQLVNIRVTLEVADQAAAEKVIAFSPRLSDAYIQALYGAIHAEHALNKGALDVLMIKQRLMEVSAQVVGAGTVRDALVQTVTQRPL